MRSYTSDSITLHLKVIFYFSHYKYIIVSVYFYNSTFLYTSSSTIVLYVVFIIVVFTLGSIATIVLFQSICISKGKKNIFQMKYIII